MTNDAKIQVCRDDFYLMMRNAVLQAGGRDDADKWMRMSLNELVNQFAQNGIRMVYMPERHVDAVQIAWEAPKNKKPDHFSHHTKIGGVPAGRREDGPLGKKLLLDADRGIAKYGDADDGYDPLEGNRG